LISQDQQRFKHAAEAFRQKFGLSAPQLPCRDSLHLLYSAFTHLPYENVSKILGSRNENNPTLVTTSFRTPEEVLEGYLHSRLGGTCFSLTHCLFTLLRHCGFNCWRVLGDMSHGPNIHCAVVVRLQSDDYLCDAGYLLPEPIKLPASGDTRAQGQIYRYILTAEPGEPGAFSLFTEPPTGGDARWRYRIRNLAVDDSTFEHHWEQSFSASMNSQLLLSRATDESHVFVHKHTVRHTTASGKHNENVRGRVGASVQELFGIDACLVERAWELSERAKGKLAGGRR
jgi:arylamine N-acetyltransferase